MFLIWGRATWKYTALFKGFSHLGLNSEIFPREIENRQQNFLYILMVVCYIIAKKQTELKCSVDEQLTILCNKHTMEHCATGIKASETVFQIILFENKVLIWKNTILLWRQVILVELVYGFELVYGSGYRCYQDFRDRIALSHLHTPYIV